MDFHNTSIEGSIETKNQTVDHNNQISEDGPSEDELTVSLPDEPSNTTVQQDIQMEINSAEVFAYDVVQTPVNNSVVQEAETAKEPSFQETLKETEMLKLFQRVCRTPRLSHPAFESYKQELLHVRRVLVHKVHAQSRKRL